MVKHAGLVFAAVSALIMAPQSKAATLEEILRVNWNQQSLAELEKLIPDQKAARLFAFDVRLKEPHTESDDIYRLDIDEDVVEYEFVDFEGRRQRAVCLSARLRTQNASDPADGS